MFSGLKNSWELIVESIVVFDRYPKLLVPLLVTWIIYAPVILYLKYGVNPDLLFGEQLYLFVFGIVFGFAFLLSFSCSMLLELIQQIETGRPLSLTQSFLYTLSQNLYKMLPLIFVWAIIWFILLLIQAMLSKKKRSDSEPEAFTAENAARTLAGSGSFSFSRAFFAALQKGIRMVMFLILPAIAWENLGFFSAWKKGLGVFKAHLSEFVSGFVLTEAAAALVFIPPAILFLLSGEMEIKFPEYVWYLTLVYIAFAWSYSIYLEQMFTAELYLWHMRWEEAVKNLTYAEQSTVPLESVPRPSILNEVSELLYRKN